MATALDIITGAMRKLGVIPSGQAPSAEEADEALECLNDLCNSWTGKDVHTGFSTLENVSDDFILDERHHGAVKAILAEALAPNYGATVSSELRKQSYQGWLMIKADYRPIQTLRVDTGLQAMPSQRRYGL